MKDKRTIDARTIVEEARKRAWAGPAMGATIAGVVVLGAAVTLGAVEVGLVAFTAYRLFSKRAVLSYTVEEGLEEVGESSLGRLAKFFVRPASATSLVLQGLEAAALAYFAYRILTEQAPRLRLAGARAKSVA